MLDNGIKLGLRDIDTELGIAILRGDHRYVDYMIAQQLSPLWFCQDSVRFRIGEEGNYCASA